MEKFSLLNFTTLWVICLFLCAVNAAKVYPNSTTTSRPDYDDHRHGKLLNLFNWWSKPACLGTDGNTGTCSSYPECFALKGSVSGICPGGFGVCCISSKTCQGVIYANNTYFSNQNYPAAQTASAQCSVTVNRVNPYICQLRLDFEVFSLAQPENVDHKCITDYFSVTGATTPVPVICGDNPGQHMYIHIGYANTKPVTLNVVTNNLPTTTSPPGRSWRIRVAQIPCNEPYAAPPGCLQYFVGTAGTIKSFNFFFDPPSTTASRQLSNQDYTMCIRQETGYCAVQYSTCVDPVNNPSLAFTISGSYIIPGGTAVSQKDADCTTDYLQIPCVSDSANQFLSSDGSVCATRLCGGAFNTLRGLGSVNLYSSSAPFEMRFHTDNLEAANGDQGNMGFCLNYKQVSCPTN